MCQAARLRQIEANPGLKRRIAEGNNALSLLYNEDG
jgi:hypothetical protein